MIFNGGAVRRSQTQSAGAHERRADHGRRSPSAGSAWRALCVYTNQVPGGYMRASGELQTVFSVGGHMDMIAERNRIDHPGVSPAQCLGIA